jgi:beta-lactamase regulating signal transducer with metallopeptidase domain
VHIFLNWILQGTIVAAATAGGLRVLRRAHAATRHAVCWTTLVAILVLPFVPSLRSLVIALMPAPTAPTAAPELPGASTGWPDPLVRLPLMVSATSALLGAAWMLWTMLQAVRVVRDVRWLRRARRRCRALPAAIAARLSPATARLIDATRAHVVLCDVVRAAAVLGGGQPVIGLQRRLVDALTNNELNAVLVHELTHVVRRDSMATVLQRAVHVLVGWHPGIWWVMRRLSLEREMACDEAALAAAGGPKAYATCLTRIAALAQVPRRAHLALGMLQASGLRRRVVHVLTPGRFSRRTAGWASGTLSTSLCVLATAMGTVVVFGEPAVAERVAALETVTTRLVEPRPNGLPASLVPMRPHPATMPSQRAARAIATAAVRLAAGAPTTTATVTVSPVVRRQDQDGSASGAVAATVEPVVVAPAENVKASAAPAETTPQAGSPTGTPGAAHDPTVTDAAVAAAAGAADAWNATASAAAKSGAAIGRSSQKRAVATAGAFTRWGRRVASSF